MKVIDGIKYYSSTEVATMVGVTRQTVVNWDKYSVELEAVNAKRLIPAPTRLGGNGNRYWTKEQVDKVMDFKTNMKPGDLAPFSRRFWGKREESIV